VLVVSAIYMGQRTEKMAGGGRVGGVHAIWLRNGEMAGRYGTELGRTGEGNGVNSAGVRKRV